MPRCTHAALIFVALISAATSPAQTAWTQQATGLGIAKHAMAYDPVRDVVVGEAERLQRAVDDPPDVNPTQPALPAFQREDVPVAVAYNVADRLRRGVEHRVGLPGERCARMQPTHTHE